MAPRYPPIPPSSTDPEALRKTDIALKETLEIITGQRGNRLDSMVTWQDLIDLGLALPTQVPK